ncbi:MAG: hypothetical protein LBP40_00740 [Campylobacteraceae bacterium]|jgi:hypothetical protein|nr:hypothetical protein [Campylobacteraceae bacterium]
MSDYISLIARLSIGALMGIFVIVLTNVINKYSGKTIYPVSQRILAFILSFVVPLVGIILSIALGIKLLILHYKREREK